MVLSVLMIITAGLFTTFAAEEKEIPEYEKLSDLNGERIGVVLGSVQEGWTKELLPDSPIFYYDNFANMGEALHGNKIDGFIVSTTTYPDLKKAYPDITMLDNELVGSSDMVLAVSKGKAQLYNELNEYLESLKADGSMDKLVYKWMDSGMSEEELGNFDYAELPDINGRLKAGIFISSAPLNYEYMGKPSGIENELLYSFCKEKGYALDYDNTGLASILSGLSTGTYDIGASRLTYTEERAESALLTTEYYKLKQYMAVRMSNGNSTSGNFWSQISERFEKNYLRESRWKMILEGLGISLLITLCAGVFGVLLSFVLYFFRNNSNQVISKIAAAYISFMQGVPILVQLMVLYYVIFAKSDISGVLVSIIGFSLSFSVIACETFRSGIHAVDVGQKEAAVALGFSNYKAFVKVVLPQATMHILPVFKTEFVSMLKMTSVVGYIAVQDLTKVTDMIRSRTYDALFPLILTSLIYFCAAWGLTSLMNLVEIKFDPKKRLNVLGDIDTSFTQIPEGSETEVGGAVGEELISLSHVRKEFPNSVPLKDVSASICRGDIIAVIGPSGTGKSTLLRCINRLETPTSGDIIAFGNNVTDKKADLCALRLKVGMVFQSFNLFPHLTVIENIMLAPVELLKMDRQQAYNEGIALLDKVGLADRATRYPDELSGGQKQRVAIVRALAMHPEMLLFDEPTSALDPTMVGEVLAVIRGLSKRGYTMMIVSHEMKFARDVSNRVFYMDQGGIYEDGTPEQVFDAPVKDRTRAFVKKLKLFNYTIEKPSFDYIELSNAINTFGHIQLMTQQTLHGVLHLVEELVMEGIMKTAGVQLPAQLSIEYSENGEATIYLQYEGAQVNILDGLDTISTKMVRSIANDVEYSYEGESNKIVAKLY